MYLICNCHEKRNVLRICENKNAEHQRGNQAAQVRFEAFNLSWVEPILSNEDEVSNASFMCAICTRVQICTRGANLHPGCIFGHVNGVFRICTRLHPGANLLLPSRWCKFICTRPGANCAHERKLYNFYTF